MFGFVFGAIAGGIAAYMWRDNIRTFVNQKMPEMRDRAAEQLGTIGERAGSALDQARSRVESGVRTGQERLRSTGTTGGAGSTGSQGQSRGGSQSSGPYGSPSS